MYPICPCMPRSIQRMYADNVGDGSAGVTPQRLKPNSPAWSLMLAAVKDIYRAISCHQGAGRIPPLLCRNV